MWSPEAEQFVHNWVIDPKDTVRRLPGKGDTATGYVQEMHIDTHETTDANSPVVIHQDQLHTVGGPVVIRQDQLHTVGGAVVIRQDQLHTVGGAAAAIFIESVLQLYMMYFLAW